MKPSSPADSRMMDPGIILAQRPALPTLPSSVGPSGQRAGTKTWDVWPGASGRIGARVVTHTLISSSDVCRGFQPGNAPRGLARDSGV
jgi:hypothetical protein